MIHLPVGRQRRAALNTRTIQGDGPGFWQQLRAKRGVPFGKLFIRCYDTIRSTALAFGRLGVGVFAIDIERRTLAGSVCLAASVGEPRLAIVGRHGLADLYLDDDETLSLRHLAIVLHGAKSWDPDQLQVSMLDLRSQRGFLSEQREPLKALEATGPVFVQIGRYALFVLGLGDATSWPASADAAWAMLPERQYDRARPANMENSPRDHLWAADAGSARKRLGTSRITLMDGPEMAQALWIGPNERPLGHLTIASPVTARTLPVSKRALDLGVIIGRDERCDQHQLLADPYISRVHVMLRRFNGRIFALDLASTGRTFATHQGKLVPMRLMPVDGVTSLTLAKGRANVVWHPLPVH